MLVPIGLIVLGVLLLVGGGESLLRGAVGLSTLLRLTPAVIGLTVVAAGTSVPELAVSAIAAHQGKADIAVANVVGSNIFNITVIVGLCALLRPIAIVGNTIKLEYPVLAVVTLLCLVLANDGMIGRLDALLCVSIYVAFTAYLVTLVRRQVTAAEGLELAEEVKELEPTTSTAIDTATPAAPRPWICLILVIIGVALLGGGAHATVSGAAELARFFGWSERLIGLTIVSIGTGLPEVVASLVSSIRGRSDIAIGNAIGSNMFNILGVLGISAAVSPLPVDPALVSSDCRWMIAVTLLLLPMLLTGKRVTRWEGATLLAVYAAYLSLLLYRSA